MESADDRLLDELSAAVARLDPVPTGVLEAGRAAYAWRTLDADLAALAYDSALDDREPVGVRGAPAPRMLSFEGDDVTVECEVHESRGRRRLVGQVLPAEVTALTVRHPAGAIAAEADHLGRFVIDDVPAGSASLSVELGDRTVTTEWVAL